MPVPSTTVQNSPPLFSMAMFEWRVGSRTLAWRMLCVIAFLYGCSIGRSDGSGAGGAAYTTGEAGWQMLSIVSIVWMSILATRETGLRTRTLVFSKPQPGERLALVKFLGGLAQVGVLLIALFVGSALFRLVGRASIGELVVYLPQFCRAAGVVFFSCCVSYTLALLTDSVIAGVLTGLYLVLVMAGRSFLAKLYYPAPVQNVGAYVALGGAILCMSLRFYGRRRRGNASPPAWIATAGVLLVGVTVWQFIEIVRNGHDPHMHQNPALDAMASQDSAVGLRAAGFLLPDQNGNPTNISRYSGKIMLIALWSPADPDSTELLNHLNKIQLKYEKRGVQVIAVCLSDDNSAARTFAIGENLQFPVVTDWGTTSVPEKLAMSPIASAYRTTMLPMVAVADRRRRIVDVVRGTSAYDDRSLINSVENQLQLTPR